MPELTKQQQFSQSLRELADFYDQHPNLSTPEGRVYFSAQFDAKDVASLPEGQDDYPAAYDLFRRVVAFGAIEIGFYCSRNKVASRVVTGQKTVDVEEWVIKPELLESPDAV